MAKQGSKFALGALIGAGIGLVTGFLTAPKSGRETRADIKQGAVAARDELEQKFASAHDELNQHIAAGKTAAAEFVGKAKQDLDSALESAKQVQGKAAEVARSLKKGEATDPDLEKVRADIEKTLKHLKSFLQK
jgi:gas vesicle protein